MEYNIKYKQIYDVFEFEIFMGERKQDWNLWIKQALFIIEE